jgi:hypothetical protein
MQPQEGALMVVVIIVELEIIGVVEMGGVVLEMIVVVAIGVVVDAAVVVVIS